jgi:hypothetical protein
MVALQRGKTITNPNQGKQQKLIHILYGTIYVSSITWGKMNVDTHQWQVDNKVSTNMCVTTSCNNLFKKIAKQKMGNNQLSYLMKQTTNEAE